MREVDPGLETGQPYVCTDCCVITGYNFITEVEIVVLGFVWYMIQFRIIDDNICDFLHLCVLSCTVFVTVWKASSISVCRASQHHHCVYEPSTVCDLTCQNTLYHVTTEPNMFSMTGAMISHLVMVDIFCFSGLWGQVYLKWADPLGWWFHCGLWYQRPLLLPHCQGHRTPDQRSTPGNCQKVWGHYNLL